VATYLASPAGGTPPRAAEPGLFIHVSSPPFLGGRFYRNIYPLFLGFFFREIPDFLFRPFFHPFITHPGFRKSGSSGTSSVPNGRYLKGWKESLSHRPFFQVHAHGPSPWSRIRWPTLIVPLFPSPTPHLCPQEMDYGSQTCQFHAYPCLLTTPRR